MAAGFVGYLSTLVGHDVMVFPPFDGCGEMFFLLKSHKKFHGELPQKDPL
jgi:hypothetical protein